MSKPRYGPPALQTDCGFFKSKQVKRPKPKAKPEGPQAADHEVPAHHPYRDLPQTTTSTHDHNQNNNNNNKKKKVIWEVEVSKGVSFQL